MLALFYSWERRDRTTGVYPTASYLQQALPSKDSNGYSEPAPLNRDLPGIKSICSDFEKADRADGISYWTIPHIRWANGSLIRIPESNLSLIINAHGLESTPMQNNRFEFQELIFRAGLKNSYDHNRIEKSSRVQSPWRSHDEAHQVHLFSISVAWFTRITYNLQWKA